MKKQSPVIVLTGGGSGGHITPLLSLARELKELAPESQLIYVGFKGDKFDSLKADAGNFDFSVFIQAGKFRRYHGESFWAHLIDLKTIALNVRDFFRVIRSIGSALRIMRRFNPDIVFSKGSFVAVPVGIAARLRGVPIITHDSDTVPGLANRIVGRWAAWHATGMPAHHYPYPKDKTTFVGIPLSDKIKEVSQADQRNFKKQLGLPDDAHFLLVSGGGLGSRTINQLILKSARSLLSSDKHLYIGHIAGQNNVDELRQEYSAILEPALMKRVKVLGFVDDFYKYSGAADVIVTRAGATTLAEFAIQKKACIVIPSPFLTGGHQLKNADELTAMDAAVILANEAEPAELIAVAGELLNNQSRRRELGHNLNALAPPHAARQLAELILKTAVQRGSE